MFQVTNQHIGQYLVESIRKQFPRQKTQRGDFYADLAYDILDANFSLIKPSDKRIIRIMIERLVLELFYQSIPFMSLS